MDFFISAGPVMALLLLGVLATRALAIAGGPEVRPRRRGFTVLMVLLATATALSMAMRLVAGR